MARLWRRQPRGHWAACWLAAWMSCLPTGYGQPRVAVHEGLEFAQIDDRKLLLDLHVPQQQTPPRLVVWIHGGRWWRGSRTAPPTGLVLAGYAMASVDYRLATESSFPAQVHDIKAAIRFLRAHATEYGYRADKIVVWGASAGGHLAALVGTTNGNAQLEGTLGAHLDQSSSVQAIIDFYGPSNLLTILEQSSLHGYKVRAPALALLLGTGMEQATEVARQASPVFHVDRSDPPLLIVHGDQDIQVPMNQAFELQGAYKQHGANVRLEILHGADHGSKVYFRPDFQKVLEEFLADVLADE